MLREERFNLILKSVEGRDAVSYETLHALIDISDATLRRDVEQLCAEGLIRKIRGGIAPVASARVKPLKSYFYREHRLRNMAAKQAIARAALSLVTPNDTLILYSGTTVACLAEVLAPTGLTVLTDSLPVANHLSINTENRVFMTGGEVFARQGIVLSPFDDGPIHHIAASSFFIGCHAISAAGVMEDDPLPLRTARALRKQAERLVVLADSSKFLESRSLVVFPLDEVDILITDDGISDKAHAMLVDAGVNVTIANSATCAAPPLQPLGVF